MSLKNGLIIGAGPVGLAVGTFLAHARSIGRLPKDFPLPRLIDAGDGDPQHSRALAVNPRTLELLEPIGITAEMFELGQHIVGAQLHRGREILLQPHIEGVPAKFQCMIAQSQAESVRMLREAFERLGGRVERQTECTTVSPQEGGHATATLKRGETLEVFEPDWIFAADGSHSVVRHALGSSFDGSSLQRPWNLVDIALETDLAQDRAHVFFLDDEGLDRPVGFLFVMRVVDRAHPRGENLWRVMGNVEHVVDRLPGGRAIGDPEWQSSFHIAHRIIGRMSEGNVYFGGDAAHLHSPMGARGMNLGIEDAWTFAEALIANRLDRYHAIRHPIDAAVVRRIRRATEVVIGETPTERTLRSIAPKVLKLLPMQKMMLRMLSGTDHPIPRVG